MLFGITLALSVAISLSQANGAPQESNFASPASVFEEALPSSELIEEGAKLYQRRCGACHSLDQNRIGPKHRGVFGRKAASVEDFRYSPALKKLDITWDSTTLDAWLTDPTSFAPGTTMGFRLSDPDERIRIIAYLRSLSASPDQEVSE